MYGNNYFNQPRYTQMPMANQPTMTTQPSYMPPITTPISQPSLLGKVVDSIEVVKAMDIPLDGSISYFPLTDGSAIISKQLQNDGTSKTVIYKPVEEEKKDLPKYATIDEVKDAISKIDLSDLEDVKDELNEIRREIKALKKKEK